MLKMLIDCGIDLNAQDDAGHTALVYYAILGLSDLAEFLIDAGADVNIRDNNGETALMFTMNDPDLLKKLIDAGADLNIRNNNGRTALQKFERMGNYEFARLLRNAGAR